MGGREGGEGGRLLLPVEAESPLVAPRAPECWAPLGAFAASARGGCGTGLRGAGSCSGGGGGSFAAELEDASAMVWIRMGLCAAAPPACAPGFRCCCQLLRMVPICFRASSPKDSEALIPCRACGSR